MCRMDKYRWAEMWSSLSLGSFITRRQWLSKKTRNGRQRGATPGQSGRPRRTRPADAEEISKAPVHREYASHLARHATNVGNTPNWPSSTEPNKDLGLHTPFSVEVRLKGERQNHTTNYAQKHFSNKSNSVCMESPWTRGKVESANLNSVSSNFFRSNYWQAVAERDETKSWPMRKRVNGFWGDGMKQRILVPLRGAVWGSFFR